MSLRIETADQVIDSAARRLFRMELERYAIDGDAARGRSFLIAGHRGAGKSFLVRRAVQELQEKELKESLTNRPLRPLAIALHGPNLLAEGDVEASLRNGDSASTTTANGDSAGQTPPAKGQADGSKGAVQPPAHPDDPELRLALEQIVLSLYRGLVTEVTTQYRARVLGPQHEPDLDLMERAAQLEIELDEYAPPERLRAFWEAGSFLRTGVLFPADSSNLPPDQGLRELVALSTACEVYRRISGIFPTITEQRKEGGKNDSEVESGVDSSKGDLLTPLASLATGGIVGGGAAFGTNPLAATVSGAVAALAATLVFKSSRTRTRSQSYEREYTFVPDRSIATLDRVLPALLKRVRDTGLVPVFVVDELDKVKDLPDRMEKIVRHLKKFVSDEAFFCFLTDRQYFEHIQRQSVDRVYPIEHTYFTNRLFVVFRSKELHGYLGKVIQIEKDARTSAPGLPASSSEADRADLQVLPYMLLHRAQMHTVDLRRSLSELQSERVTHIRSHGSAKYDLMIQMAIRVLLDGELRDVLDREPAFTRLAYDALYYPSRLRRLGEAELDLSDDTGREAFKRELERRMRSDEREPMNGKAAEADDPGKAQSMALELSSPDHQFLLNLVRRLASLLADPFAYLDAIEVWEGENPENSRLSRNFMEALPLVHHTGPLLTGGLDGSHIYEWGYDHLGRRMRKARSPVAYSFELEYRLATLMVLRGGEPARPHPREAELSPVLWLPYRRWRNASQSDLRPHPPILEELHLLEDEQFAAQLQTLLPGHRHDTDALDEYRRLLRKLLEVLSDGNIKRESWAKRYQTIIRRFARHEPLLAPLERLYQVADRDQTAALNVQDLEKDAERHGEEDTDRSIFGWLYTSEGEPIYQEVAAPELAALEPWEDQAELLRGMDERIRSFTDDELNLARLGSELNVMPASPEWVDVRAAIGRLDAARLGRPSATHGEDESKVKQFSSNLQQSGDAVSLGVAAGMLLGRLAGERSARDALLAIRDAYGLVAGRGRSAEEVMRVVLELLGWRERVEPPPDPTPRNRKAWLEWLDRLKEKMDEWKPDAISVAAASMAAWHLWRERMHEFLTTQQRQFEPELVDLIARTAGKPPATYLTEDLLEMTATGWSALLVAATAPAAGQGVPPWAVLPAIAALGLDPDVTGSSRLLTTGAKAGVSDHEVMKWRELVATRALREPAVLFVRADSSLAVNWRPPENAALLVLSAAELLVLCQASGNVPPLDLSRFGHIVVENGEPGDEVAHQLLNMLESLDTARPEIWQIAGNPIHNSARPLPPPDSVDELLAALTLPPQERSPYLRVLGPRAERLPATLSRALAQPELRAAGEITFEGPRGPIALLASVLLRMPQSYGPNIGVEVVVKSAGGESRLRLTTEHNYDATGTHEALGPVLRHVGSRYSVDFDLTADGRQVRLRQTGLRVRNSVAALLLRPRFRADVSAVGAGWQVDLEARALGRRILHVNGVLSPEAPSGTPHSPEPPLTSTPVFAASPAGRA